MAAELVRYSAGIPAIDDDGLIADTVSLRCDQCGIEYRLHYSQGELYRINKLRFEGKHEVQHSHGGLTPHPDSLSLYLVHL